MFMFFIFFIFMFFMFVFAWVFAFAGLAVAVGVGSGDVAAAAFALAFALFVLSAVAQPTPKRVRTIDKINPVVRIERFSSFCHSASENSSMMRSRIFSADNPCFCKA